MTLKPSGWMRGMNELFKRAGGGLRRFIPDIRPREFWKYLGPGLLVTVGFIDPGNWATNVAAGSRYGLALLWVITLSTVMLIVLQHNAAHLGIATGLCLSEAARKHLRPGWARLVLGSAMAACAATAFAEIMGGAIALRMLFGLPLKVGAAGVTLVSALLLYTHSYDRVERFIIGFVSLIGVAFMFEVAWVPFSAADVARAWVTPSLPSGALPVVMGVLGAVVMPHNLFLHSEIIQSRHWNLQDPQVIDRQLRYEYLDTLVSMAAGWAINSAMIVVAAGAFFARGVRVEELEQAQELLRPLVGPAAAVVFALALLLAGLSSSVTAGMAGGTVWAGLRGEEYDIRRPASRAGVGLTLLGGLGLCFAVKRVFDGLVASQVFLSVQLPVTVVALVVLTSSPRVMGRYANTRGGKIILWTVTAVVVALNALLLAGQARDWLGK